MKRILLATACAAAFALPMAGTARAQEVPAWSDKGTDEAAWMETKAALQAFGAQFDSALAMYRHMESALAPADELSWEDMAAPEYDWSGVFTRTKGGLSFDPDIKASENSAPLTEAGAAVRETKVKMMAETGGEYDPISDCRPPGFPRWLTEPFLHDFVVTPDQTYLMNEMVNDVRRVYTDGRDHTDPADAYPSWNGDTIGFWKDGALYTHTAYLKPGQYQRGTQPDYSDQVEVVERWHKTDDITLQADIWVFDPVNLTEAWYTRQSWTELANDDYFLRIRYWDCRENQNNDIIVRDDGTSQFPDFDFVADDAAVSDDASVKAAAGAN